MQRSEQSESPAPAAERQATPTDRVSPAPRAMRTAPRGARTQLRVQPLLTVGSVDDPYEREADRVADDVVSRMLAGGGDFRAPGLSATPRISRLGVPDAGIAVGPEGGTVDDDLSRRITSARGGGAPIARSTRDGLEDAFGSDFGKVRVHADSDVAPQIGAKAFTLGHDIHFAPGQYDPGSRDGLRTLSHELTHVVQQTGTVARKIRRSTAATDSTIRRDIGFEFETRYLRVREMNDGGTVPADVRTKPPAEKLIDFENRIRNASKRIPKAQKVLEHAKFTLEGDDKGSNDSSTEFVTKVFPMTNSGRTDMVNAFQAMVAVEAKLQAMSELTGRATAQDLAGGGVTAKMDSVFFTDQPYSMGFVGAPQMTMGLGLQDVQSFVKDLLYEENESATDANDRLPGRQIVRTRPGQPAGAAKGLANAVKLADQAITAYALVDPNMPPPSDKLRGLLTLIYSIPETVALGDVTKFLKQSSDLLAKTNYATMYKMLPQAERDYYASGSKLLKKRRPPFVDLVASAPGYLAKITQPLFDVGQRVSDEVNATEAEWYKNLIFEDWVESMTSGSDKLKNLLHGRGKDLLTTKNFPDKPKGKTLEGFGVLGDKTDTGPGGEALPVMEFRSFNKDSNLATFALAAVKLFDYVRDQNSGFDTKIT